MLTLWVIKIKWSSECIRIIHECRRLQVGFCESPGTTGAFQATTKVGSSTTTSKRRALILRHKRLVVPGQCHDNGRPEILSLAKARTRNIEFFLSLNIFCRVLKILIVWNNAELKFF